VQGKATTAPEG